MVALSIITLGLSLGWGLLDSERSSPFIVYDARPLGLTIALNLETIVLLLPTYYFVCFWGLAGSSIGKRIVGLRLVGPDGYPVQGLSGVGRAFVRLLVMSLLAPLGITWWPLFLRKDRRAIHDLAAGTEVAVNREDQPTDVGHPRSRGSAGYAVFGALAAVVVAIVPFVGTQPLLPTTTLILRADVSSVPNGDLDRVLEATVKVIERRLNAYGLIGSSVKVQNRDRLLVEFRTRNPEEVKSLIGRMAQMDFREQKTVEGQQQWVIATATGTDGVETPLTGRYFKKAEVGFDQGSKPMILFEFDGEGGKLFGEITTRLKGKQLGIFLDDTPISTPRVQEAITGGRGQITGSFTLDEVRNLVIQLNSGALPVPLVIERQS